METGERRKAWSKYVFAVKKQQDAKHTPSLGWYEIIPIKMYGGALGQKKVRPSYRYLKLGPGKTRYRMSQFQKAAPWERDLIEEVEEQAAMLREGLKELRVLERGIKKFVALAKQATKVTKKYAPYLAVADQDEPGLNDRVVHDA